MQMSPVTIHLFWLNCYPTCSSGVQRCACAPLEGCFGSSSHVKTSLTSGGVRAWLSKQPARISGVASSEEPSGGQKARTTAILWVGSAWRRLEPSHRGVRQVAEEQPLLPGVCGRRSCDVIQQRELGCVFVRSPASAQASLGANPNL